jgi:hypothetical protein
MQYRSLSWAVAGAAAIACQAVARAQFAAEIVGYNPGTGFATEFGTGAGYTNAAAALGEPSRVTPGQFGGPVDPFNPPYLTGQIVSVGTGGELTVRLGQPAVNRPANPYGLDFVIFGAAGFIITNGDFSGGGVTDGSLFGGGLATTRVSVSYDGGTFYQLDPALAPVVEGLFPMDGQGDFTKPVNPALTGPAFNGLGLAGIRLAYDGSGGGTGYDLAWARDGGGNPVALAEANYVRINVLSGRAEVDGFAAVVPEPGPWALLGGGLALLGLARRRRRA